MSSFTPNELAAAIDRLGDRLTPAQRALFLKAVARIQDAADLAAFVAALESGDVDAAVAAVFDTPGADAAFADVAAGLTRMVAAAGETLAAGVPVLVTPQGVTTRVALDVRHPSTAKAVEAYTMETLDTLSSEMRAGLRDFVRQGMTVEGANPREVGRRVAESNVIGLSPYDVSVVENTRLKLLSKDAGYFALKLRNRRLDAKVRKAMAAEGDMPADLVDEVTDEYEKRRLGFRAETHARTAALDTARLAQRQLWQQQVDDGTVDKADLERVWHTTMDGRERPEHHAMNERTAKWGEDFVGPPGPPTFGRHWEYVGEGDYGCRCVEFTRVSMNALRARAHRALAKHRGKFTAQQNAAIDRHHAQPAQPAAPVETPEPLAPAAHAAHGRVRRTAKIAAASATKTRRVTHELRARLGDVEALLMDRVPPVVNGILLPQRPARPAPNASEAVWQAYRREYRAWQKVVIAAQNGQAIGGATVIGTTGGTAGANGTAPVGASAPPPSKTKAAPPSAPGVAPQMNGPRPVKPPPGAPAAQVTEWRREYRAWLVAQRAQKAAGVGKTGGSGRTPVPPVPPVAPVALPPVAPPAPPSAPTIPPAGPRPMRPVGGTPAQITAWRKQYRAWLVAQRAARAGANAPGGAVAPKVPKTVPLRPTSTARSTAPAAPPGFAPVVPPGQKLGVERPDVPYVSQSSAELTQHIQAAFGTRMGWQSFHRDITRLSEAERHEVVRLVYDGLRRSRAAGLKTMPVSVSYMSKSHARDANALYYGYEQRIEMMTTAANSPDVRTRVAEQDRAYRIGAKASDDPSGTVIHELGHHAHNVHDRQNFANLPRGSWAQAGWWSQAERDLVTLEVSSYAGTSPAEMVAEVWRGAVGGKRYSAEVMAIYTRFKGHPIDFAALDRLNGNVPHYDTTRKP